MVTSQLVVHGVILGGRALEYNGKTLITFESQGKWSSLIPVRCSPQGACLVKAAGNHSSGGEATGERGPATEPQTWDLRSNTEVQPCELRNQANSFISHLPYVPYTSVLPTATA